MGFGGSLGSMQRGPLTGQQVHRTEPLMTLIIITAIRQWRKKGSDIFQRGFGALRSFAAECGAT